MIASAMAGGSLIFLGFLIAAVFVVAYAYYTRAGSGINQRPRGARADDQPGAQGASRISSAEEAGQPPQDYRN